MRDFRALGNGMGYLLKETFFWTLMLLMLPFVILITWWALKDDKDEK